MNNLSDRLIIRVHFLRIWRRRRTTNLRDNLVLLPWWWLILSSLLNTLTFVLVDALFHIILFHIHFWNNTHLKLLTSQCEVMILALADLVVNSFNFKSIFLCLRLKMLYFSNHLFKLLRPLLKGLLVKHKFLSNLRATLFSQNVFQFYIKLFLLLNQNILLQYLLCLCNQTFLKGLDLLYQLVSIDISGF